MSDPLLKLLNEKKVADAYQFCVSCDDLLYYAETSYKALENVETRYHQDSCAGCSAHTIKELDAFLAKDDYVDYLGVQMDATVVMDKLTMDIIGYLHSFFDTFAQWLSRAMLGEDAPSIESVSLNKFCTDILDYPEYAGIFRDRLVKIPTQSEYRDIADFNNISKHRCRIHIQNQYDIVARKVEVNVPSFINENYKRSTERTHPKEPALDVLKHSLDYCKELFTDSLDYVKQYYACNDNNHVSHRIYNPGTYLAYNSEDDYMKLPPVMHYHYIEVDSANIQEYYQILLCGENTDQDNNVEIRLANSPYDIIMLREKDTSRLIGVLKPDDSFSFENKGFRPITYRKYNSILSDYEQDMIYATDGTRSFSYYPNYSKIQLVTINS